MRFVIAQLMHETNTFSPVPTPLAAFGRVTGGDAPARGQAAIDAYAGTNSEPAAFLELAREAGADVAFAIAAVAGPSAPAPDAILDVVAEAVLDALRPGADALLLSLHGAMVTEGFDDGEGELLRRLRAQHPDLPIAVSLDFHTNLSPAMAQHATTLAGYRTYPHVDKHGTGMRAGRALLRAIREEVRPTLAWGRLPLLTAMLQQDPARPPMAEVLAPALAAEAEGRALCASVFGGFPLADIPHAGLSAVVVTDGDSADAQAQVDELLQRAWQRREGFVFTPEPLAEAVARAKALPEGPILLVDHGDNSGAGGGQDNMAALREVLRQGLSDLAVGPICDPPAVARLVDAGEGASVTVDLGGRWDLPALGVKGEPLRLSGRVARITDGTYRVTGPMSTGMQVRLGRTAVLDTGAAQIVVSERRVEPSDVGCFTHAGIDPAAKRYVLLKSRQHFRAGFGPLARHVVLLAAPGPCSEDFGQLRFRHLRRPIYPLDSDTRWPMT